MPGRSAVYRLAVGRVISIGGGAAAFMALNIVVLDKTGSTKWMAAAMFFTFGISGLLGPVGGWISDRYDRRRVMIWSDVIGAVAFGVMVFLHDPVLLIAAAFVAAAAEVPFWSASSAAIPSLAPPDYLNRANAVLVASRNMGVMLGPLVGGAMVATVGADGVFAFNAVTFLASALLIYNVHLPFQEERGELKEDEKGMAAGFVFLIHDRPLLYISIAWTTLVLGLGMAMVADLPLVQQFGKGDAAYGLLIACWGGGAMLGTLSGRWMGPRSEPMFLIGGTLVITVGSAVTALTPMFGFILGGILLAGIGDSATVVAEESIRQRRTPDAIRSRVIAFSQMGWQIAFAVAFVFGGFAVDAWGPQGVYGFGAITAGAASLMLIPAVRAIRAEQTELEAGRAKAEAEQTAGAD